MLNNKNQQSLYAENDSFIPEAKDQAVKKHSDRSGGKKEKTKKRAAATIKYHSIYHYYSHK